MHEYGCILIKIYLWILKLDLNFRMSQNIILCCFSQPFKNVNIIIIFFSLTGGRETGSRVNMPTPAQMIPVSFQAGAASCFCFCFFFSWIMTHHEKLQTTFRLLSF